MKVFLLPLFLFFQINNHHPFFLSVTELEYFAKDKRLGISVKLFSDDIENAINENKKNKMDITNGNKTTNNVFLKDYFQNHINISINGQTHSAQFLGYELDKDATWVYLELNEINSTPKTIGIKTDILYSQHQEQVNIVHAMVNGKRISKRLTFPEQEFLFNY